MFNAKNVVDGVKERRAVPKLEDSTSSPNAFRLMASGSKILRDENARLSSKVSALSGRVDSLDSRFGDVEAWQAEAQKRVNKLETVTGGTSQRACPGCQEFRHDGPENPLAIWSRQRQMRVPTSTLGGCCARVP